ncbi:hypothetical protein COLO4_13585 [Corchorus olitorius]|uniref:Zinc knuckle CX2CX4HX4C n=1 Tax=Corchorus olitorius TaxID=93759 RepID=A0A1R3JVT1_9ROSI|nr:hypothetical protein COLO4_13585 [Corchorus olitorius]
MPDICLVCGQFDHLSENECPTAIEMRLNHGIVIKKQPPLSTRSGPVRQSMGGGRAAQPSSSVGDNRRHIRQHVDSLIMRGKQVAQALGADAVSCEVISRIPGRVVEQNQGVEKSGEAVERIVQAAANFAKEVDELYGDLGLPDSQGSRGKEAVGEDHVGGNVMSKKKAVIREPIYAGVSTTDSTFRNLDLRHTSRDWGNITQKWVNASLGRI